MSKFQRLVNQLLQLQGSLPLAGLWLFTSLYYLYFRLTDFLFPSSLPSATLQGPPITSPPSFPEGPSVVYLSIPQSTLPNLLTDVLITILFIFFGLFTAGLFIPKKIRTFVIAILSIFLSREFLPFWDSISGTSNEIFSPPGILISIIFALWSKSYLYSFFVGIFSTVIVIPFFHISHQISQVMEQGFVDYLVPTLSNTDAAFVLRTFPQLIPISVISSVPALLTVFLARNWQKMSSLPGLSNRLIRYFLILILISPFVYFFILSPIIFRLNPPSPPPAPPSILSEIPICVGEMTFNEMNNAGFTEEKVVAWSSQDLKVTTGGKITGTFETNYEGQVLHHPLLKDFLFIQVRADYVGTFGDRIPDFLSDVIPLIAQQSTAQSAKFSLDSTFGIPSLVKDGDELGSLWVTLTWVRVYKDGNTYYFHVFPGYVDPASSYIPFITFDQDPKPIIGRFGYYQVLPESSLGGGDFDYRTWIKKNIQR